MKEKLSVKKNERYTLDIIDLSYEGMGVAKIDGYPLFIENALPGERVEVLVVKAGNKFGYGKVEKWLTESPDRQPLKDNRLLRTGIAPLAHLNYEQQLLFKQKQVENVMSKIAKMPEVDILPTIPMENPVGYRNKAQIPVRRIDGRLATGFYKKNSHELVEIEDYYIQDPAIDEAIKRVRDILQRFQVRGYNEAKNEGQIRHIIIRRGHYSHEMMVVLVTRKEKFFKGKEIASIIHEELPEVVSVVQNINEEKTNVILGDKEKVLYGRNYIEDQLLGKTYRISSKSFYQVNTEQTEKLYQTAIEFAALQKEDTVIDAYSGIGTIGLSLADKVKEVYGMELVPEAIEDAQFNALTNKIENAHYEVGKAETVMKKWQDKGIKPSVIVVDPPRKGLDARFIASAIDMEPAKLVYISCNPATFARDAKLFAESGYEVKKVQPVDLFPQTHHVELVALLAPKG
ncbi:23S rRNA (uracil(1939)-C(5))-methyltransferase RlmD [Enterococcus hirae]|uniref:23S rRNA (uracil(1939)-C(5))-methyltransferase RlmD n=1 Tax=Enterococcus hirae TaxID=1354 RepID=UPI001363B5FD|nr:23S rRNA (uracil(1939)-C(5))-methyltransferase RlmD [Enterococcus hirae]EMF0047991.1 23S rRNA (uracil(1939)-C(5))-methyltransferase RlmD [Enterococcus hirae]EMF0066589.1 23S rRNA (uracil(1939)-C(5))-methyltransferase RlmD [Enterococcus hirae]EMF0116456.1 23S rRNA (uracil(1939)-C(5))-methyltransferase RlmD [Enterococcus hirae]EMF0123102.1 23S rRNA (uracil(1939)-C(5))-methyltransferase RlmD [Enterococcus hirae]EMF0141478.1 23S rRNA (uracil(1939)-C(5))-methyltransferase RlmD [Enterococcus hira